MKIGIAGIGFMGMIHYLSYQKLDGVDVVALAEPNESRLAGDWTDIKGNFGPQGQMMDLAGIAKFTDVAAMIAESDIDAIDICLPPGMHAPVATAALEAGKHVFCEKPITLTTDGASQMVAAAKAADRLLLIGHVLPFLPEYQKAYEIIQSGEFGRVIGGHFKRVIDDPQWLAHYWDAEKVGGPMLDLHVHDAHFIRLLFGMPTSVASVGRMRDDLAEYWNSQFEFADKSLVVTATSGVINQHGRTFLHGYEIHLEKATLAFEFAVIGDRPESLLPLTVLTPDGGADRPDLGGGDPMLSAFESELSEVVNSITTGSPSPILDGNLARDAVVLCQKQTESIRTRERVTC